MSTQVAPRARLRNIVVYEASGRRREGFDEDVELTVTGSRPPVEAHLRLREHNWFDARFRVEQVTAEAHLIADVSATYRLANDDEVPSQDELSEFAVRSALYHVWPFLRQSLFDTAHRLGVKAPILALTLPADLVDEDDDIEALDAPGHRTP